MRKRALVLPVLLGVGMMILPVSAAEHEVEPHMLIPVWAISPMHVIEVALALFVLFMSVKLTRATGQADKFRLISVGMALLAISSILLFIGHLSHGTSLEISEELVNLASRLLTIAMLALVGLAFYRWDKMVRE